jgi:hypothetical protein
MAATAPGPVRARRGRQVGMTSVEEENRLGDSQRRGVESAAQVFERLMAQIEERGRTSSPLNREPDGAGVRDGSATGLHQIRVAAAAAIDAYADMVQRTFELYADLVEDGARPGRQAVGADGSRVELTGSPGACARTTVWAHNSTDGPAVDVALRLTDLTAHDGTVIAAEAGSFEPVRLTMTTGASVSAWLTVVIPPDTPTGSYYGHVLATGLPDGNAPVRVVVQR